ncbi:MAG: hypothetical protein EOM23_05065, partial [Candidatus Moranbacteria bacterium]|nr:hypothetical protein [Candidatus Moranbacteria bacterium]
TFDHFKQILAKNLEEGEEVNDFVERIGKDNLTSTLGINKTNKWYADVVYRTSSASAYSAGKLDARKENKAIMMLEYLAVGDERTTDICDSRNGTVLPKENAFWRDNTPPMHYQCRSDIVEYTEAYVSAFDIQEFQPAEIEPALDGFGSTEGYETGNWVFPTKKMREDIQEFVK